MTSEFNKFEENTRQELLSTEINCSDPTKSNEPRQTGSTIQKVTENLIKQESEQSSISPVNSLPQPLGTIMSTENNLNEIGVSERTDPSSIIIVDELDKQQNAGTDQKSNAHSSSNNEETHNAKVEREYDPTIDDNLPDTVTLLHTKDGGKVYLVGTAHFSVESQNDVSKIIQAVQPHIVMLELCKARINLLQLDEETILEQAQNLSASRIRETIMRNGLYNGLMYILLLNMSAYCTRELGMAPGGEFRTAFAEAKKIPNCMIHVGDRPIKITIKRALSSLTWWQTLKLGWHLLIVKEPITKEDVERCKQRDLLEDLLTKMTGEFPTIGEVFVKERDTYLTHSLQLASLPRPTPNGLVPVRVVGVVGIGHTPGIIRNWGKVKPRDIAPLLRIPSPSLSGEVVKFTIKASLFGLIAYTGYKIIVRTSSVMLQSFKSSFEALKG